MLGVKHYKAHTLIRDPESGYTFKDEYIDIPIYSNQYCLSEGHAWPQDRGVRDAGGVFDTMKTWYENDELDRTYRATYKSSGWVPSYTEGSNIPYAGGIPGQFLYPIQQFSPDNTWLDWIPMSPNLQLDVLGTKFISQTIPTNPIVDASVSLAELYREGLPSLIGATFLRNKAGFFRDLGSEYLNYQFGWKPFVADVKNAAKAIIEQEDILLQLERDSGRDVHRKRFLPAAISTDLVYNTGIYPSSLGDSVAAMPTGYCYSVRDERRQWFSGSYTYYFEPNLKSEVSRIATEARLLYGLTLTPEVIWNIAPWSWLVDWVTNVGDVFHNVSAFQNDGLVLRYGYVMEQNSKKVIRHNRIGAPIPGATSTYPSVSRDAFMGLRKARRKATPYGFGLLESAFTTRQWSILGALGITRAPKRL